MSMNSTPDFLFNERKSFLENCDAFLNNLECVDMELTAILRENWDLLVSIVQEGERNLKIRGELNTMIAKALDSLVKVEEVEDGA